MEMVEAWYEDKNQPDAHSNDSQDSVVEIVSATFFFEVCQLWSKSERKKSEIWFDWHF